jgi:hypothetical protein
MLKAIDLGRIMPGRSLGQPFDPAQRRRIHAPILAQ